MSDLDDKLNKILNDFERLIEEQGSALGSDNGKAIAQIHIAFQEAGYVKLEDDIEVKDNIIRIRDLNLMTGAEWYQRFKAELPQDFDGKSANGNESWFWQSSVLEAAQRAAGINETKEQN